ncbi:MAG TPA: alpha-amylase [Gemmatimonadaceae bacterium]|nr:alpha-amylase [Gemmatimonadaceae bacterium]
MSGANGVMMQYFHWYVADDGSLWRDVSANAETLAALGFTSLWLPPAYKGHGGARDVGYGAYDLFDLGEFDQKGSVRTKYGTRQEFIEACASAQRAGLRIYADAVFNHKLGADEQEDVEGTPINPHNRDEAIGTLTTARVWTHFTFPGRAGMHSTMQWHWHHFTAVDRMDESGMHVFLFKDKQFDDDVDGERGNYDYLMGCDIDINHPEVRGELEYWGEWFVNATGVDGFRFDAAKHVDAGFFRDWMHAVSSRTGKELFAVAEYWSYDVDTLQRFIEITEGRVTLFDAPLHHNFHVASTSGSGYDLRRIFDDTLVQTHPMHAVTLVENHDSQPLQALESVVEAWFKPLAYALILLRRDGYPCVFHADYFGADYRGHGRDGQEYDIHLSSHREIIDILLRARQSYAYGEQHDFFDGPNLIGWTRTGDAAHPGGMAVVLSIEDGGALSMVTGVPDIVYADVTGRVPQQVCTDANGCAVFGCQPGSVSVWLPVALENDAAAPRMGHGAAG